MSYISLRIASLAKRMRVAMLGPRRNINHGRYDRSALLQWKVRDSN